MVPIIKRLPPPPGLVALQEEAAALEASPEAAFEMLQNPLKGQLRNQLALEQGGLCAYCMCQIPRKDVDTSIAPIVIEHYIARKPEDGRDVGQGLDYSNLFVVCHGNRGRRGTRTHADLTCDAHRENMDFRKVNLMEPATLNSIFYHLDGRIDAEDEDVKYDLVETLNLNCQSAPLLAERKATLDELLQSLDTVQDDELLTYCESALNSYLAEVTEKTPYVGIVIWYLRDLVIMVPQSRPQMKKTS